MKLDYHDFWEVFMEEYLPNKISNEWLVANEAFIEELMNAHYRTYEISNIEHSVMMRIISEAILLSFIYFKEYNVI